jgi:hypothetical protein
MKPVSKGGPGPDMGKSLKTKGLLEMFRGSEYGTAIAARWLSVAPSQANNDSFRTLSKACGVQKCVIQLHP